MILACTDVLVGGIFIGIVVGALATIYLYFGLEAYWTKKKRHY